MAIEQLVHDKPHPRSLSLTERNAPYGTNIMTVHIDLVRMMNRN
jgi:hypothetical protein